MFLSCLFLWLYSSSFLKTPQNIILKKLVFVVSSFLAFVKNFHNPTSFHLYLLNYQVGCEVKLAEFLSLIMLNPSAMPFKSFCGLVCLPTPLAISTKNHSRRDILWVQVLVDTATYYYDYFLYLFGVISLARIGGVSASDLPWNAQFSCVMLLVDLGNVS